MHARNIKQVLSVAVGSATAVMAVASSPAMGAAEDWNSPSDPLIAWEDGDAQALGFGTSYTKEGHLKNHTWYKDPRPTGDSVYTETDYDVFVVKFGESGWRGRCCEDQSSRSNSGRWRNQYDKWYFASIGGIEKGRTYSKVCEDQSWSPDACSVNPFVTFNL